MDTKQMNSERGFLALFATQFLGALNDNLFKNALVIFITFRASTLGTSSPSTLVALSGAVFILPFFLFSALAGQLADKHPKASLVRAVKFAEILIMAVGGIGFIAGNLVFLFAALFLMGLHSTFFGPLKYGALPELLPSSKLVRGNAWVEMGTFIAILIGTIVGGTLISQGDRGQMLVPAAGLAVAVLGFLSAQAVPKHAAADPALRVDYGLFRPSWQLIRLAASNRTVWHSVLGISWFWLIGAVILSVLPALVTNHLGGTELVVTYLLTLFSIGIGVGSLLCAKLSHQQLELGVVPIGAFGMTIFLLDAALSIWGTSASPNVASVQSIVQTAAGLRLSADLGLFAVASGIFIVPLYTLLQERSSDQTRARLIAANNIMNAAFMVLGSVLLAGLLALGAKIPEILAFVAVANLAVAVYTYTVIPEFMFRFICFCLAHVLYRLKISGRERIPAQGAAVLVCNHVTFVDWLVLSAATQRPIRFVMHHEFLKLPLTGRLFRDAKVIPIAGAKENPEVLEAAFAQISEALKAGELVCIFPEGQLTRDGRMAPFRRGVERIIASDPAPVIPMRLDGLWKSVFSRHSPRRPFRRVWSRVELTIGTALEPEALTASELEHKVAALEPANA